MMVDKCCGISLFLCLSLFVACQWVALERTYDIRYSHVRGRVIGYQYSASEGILVGVYVRLHCLNPLAALD